MGSVIQFYRVNDEYGCFSNFAPYPIELRGKVWPTSEHFFQAQKFPGTEHEEAIRQEKSPMIAARMGRDRKKPLRADWESIMDTLRSHKPGVPKAWIGWLIRNVSATTGNDSFVRFR